MYKRHSPRIKAPANYERTGTTQVRLKKKNEFGEKSTTQFLFTAREQLVKGNGHCHPHYHLPHRGEQQ